MNYEIEFRSSTKKSKFIGIVGSRRRNSALDLHKVEEAFGKYYVEGDVIISGGCPKGGDRFAEVIAEKTGIPILIFYPQKWMGKGAFFARNTDIALNSNILIACVTADRTGGTEDTIKKFLREFYGEFRSKNRESLAMRDRRLILV